MDLTQEQERIVAHSGGHAKVSAVAGSGKTTTMVARVRYLLRQGVAPQRLLVLMFNKSARDSFAASLAAALQPEGLAPPEVRTFHSLGLRLINSFNRRGVLPVHTLLTAEFQLEKFAKEAVREVMNRYDDSRDWLTKENMEGLLTFIDLVKADTRPAAHIFAELGLAPSLSYYVEAFQLFEAGRRAKKVRFYADLIHEPVMAILSDPGLADWVGNHVDHIIVDEYQDINEVQHCLLKAIAGTRAKVMVVGDVDQCIYEWRGARPEYIVARFQHDFPAPSVYTLSYTFRFGHRLSLTANHLIRNNRLRDRKLCLSCPDSQDTRLDCLPETDPHPILAIIAGWQQRGRTLSEATVLVRLFAMSVPLELALLQAGIPYRLEGHERVFDCQEIKALTGFLMLCHRPGNLSEDIILAMLANPHLGLKRERLHPLAIAIANSPGQAPALIIGQADRDTPPFLQKQLEQTAVIWKEIQGLPATAKAHDLLTAIIGKTKLFDFYRAISSRSSLAENKIKTCQAFVSFARRLDQPVAPFLDEIDLLHRMSTEAEGDCLLITSIHRAKGLEWPLVIIPGLDDGSFPLLDNTPESVLSNLEDERRLFYVAMTRAKEQVFFIHPPDSRLSKQQKTGASHFITPGDSTATASRFLYEANLGLSSRLGQLIHDPHSPAAALTAVDCELANAYLAAIDCPLPRVQPPESRRKRPATGDFLKTNDLAEGMMVRHQTFGTGVVTAVPDRRQGKVEVLFGGHGKKVLIADIAKLQAV